MDNELQKAIMALGDKHGHKETLSIIRSLVSVADKHGLLVVAEYLKQIVELNKNVK